MVNSIYVQNITNQMSCRYVKKVHVYYHYIYFYLKKKQNYLVDKLRDNHNLQRKYVFVQKSKQ